jgi:hypothetical protein
MDDVAMTNSFLTPNGQHNENSRHQIVKYETTIENFVIDEYLKNIYNKASVANAH